MKAISLWQPWATLIALGHKRLETRSWQTSYRGPLAIHAAQRWTDFQQSFCEHHPRFRQALSGDLGIGQVELPRGVLVAVVDLLNCRPTALDDQTLYEEPFGDFSLGRWVWVLGNVRKIDHPIQCRGKQRLWDLDEVTTRLVSKAIR